jgi:hypothetical protein
MKKILFLILFLSTIIYTTNGQTNTDKEQIKNVISGSFDVLFSDLKIEQIPNYYTTDFILLEDGEIWDIAKLEAHFNFLLKKEKLPKRINKFDFKRIEITDNTAWVAYYNEATLLFEGKTKIINWLESAL